MTKAWDSGLCTACGKSLFNVDSAILSSGCYCPDCVEPKQGRWFACFTQSERRCLVGPFNDDVKAANWLKDFCYGHSMFIVKATSPDYS